MNKYEDVFNIAKLEGKSDYEAFHIVKKTFRGDFDFHSFDVKPKDFPKCPKCGNDLSLSNIGPKHCLNCGYEE